MTGRQTDKDGQKQMLERQTETKTEIIDIINGKASYRDYRLLSTQSSSV